MVHLVMGEGTLLIEGDGFGVVLRVSNGRVHPGDYGPLEFMEGWEPDAVIGYARRKGWLVSATFGPPEPDG